jgi:DNA-binding response OmpR family regulator
MILQTLLVSKDDQCAELLIKVLVQFGVVVDRSSAVDVALARLSEERFDQVIVDFDSEFNDPEAARMLLESCRCLAGCEHRPPVTVALLHDRTQIRSILGAGAHFILTKPVDQEQAHNTFRAATALLKRERRKSARVAVQAEISLRVSGDDSESTLVEGILLDLSTGGMDVLAAQPVPSGGLLHASFALPGGGGDIEGEAEVAWSTDNGQVGLRFVEMDAKMRQQLHEWLAAHSQDALPEEVEAVTQCKLTDLSLGGCYVQTESPFPQSSAVDLCLRVAEMEIHAEGVVRVMHPGHGMGVEFPARTAEQRKSVSDFLACLTGQPGADPKLEISPRALVASTIDIETDGADRAADGDAEGSSFGESSSGDSFSEDSVGEASGSEDLGSEDPLLELLRTGHTLDEEAFLEELQRQRNPESVTQ